MKKHPKPLQKKKKPLKILKVQATPRVFIKAQSILKNEGQFMIFHITELWPFVEKVSLNNFLNSFDDIFSLTNPLSCVLGSLMGSYGITAEILI